MPKVSICIPAYKNPILLKKALDSVMVQSYTDFEVIITDDSPNDDVGILIKSYSNNTRISYFKNPVSLGSPENWNKSISLAKGEYIKILHHDDWFTDENSLQQFVNLLDNNPNADFAFSGAHVQFENGVHWIHSASKLQLKKLTDNPIVLFRNNFIGAPSATIYRKSVFQEFDSKLKWVVDFEFYIRILSKNGNFSSTEKPLVVTFCVSGRVSDSCANDKNIELFEYFYLYEKLKKLYSHSLQLLYCQFFLAELCIKHRVRKEVEIREVGFEGDISIFIKLVLFLNKVSNKKLENSLRMIHRIKAKISRLNSNSL